MLRPCVMVLGVLTLALIVAGVAPAATYTLVDIGTLKAYDGSLTGYSYAYAVNDSGKTVGRDKVQMFAGDAGYDHLFSYASGTLSDLGMGPNGGVVGNSYVGSNNNAYGRGVNNDGVICGDASFAGNNIHAMVYSNGAYTDLGGLGAADTQPSRAYAVNSHGVVSGTAYTSTGYTHAFVNTYSGTYSNGVYSGGSWSMVDVGGGAGDSHASYAYAINDLGVAVGMYNSKPYTFAGGSPAYIGGGVFTAGGQAHGMNHSGQIVGYAISSSDSINHAFLYDGTMHDLGLLVAGKYAMGYSINDSGVVVGAAQNAAGTVHAAIWGYNGVAGAQDMNDPSVFGSLLPTGWFFNYAESISNTGYITGWITNSSDSTKAHGFILVPQPEPSTLLLTATGLAGLLAYAWRKRK